MPVTQITEYHLDAIKEIFNIGVGRGAKVLSQLLESSIKLQVPEIQIFEGKDLAQLRQKIGSDDLSNVKMNFNGSYDGTVALSFERETAKNIVGVLIEEEPSQVELDSVSTGTLCEVGNMIINSLMGSVTNILTGEVHYSLPEYTEESLEVALNMNKTEPIVVVVADTLMTIEKLHANVVFIAIFQELTD